MEVLLMYTREAKSNWVLKEASGQATIEDVGADE